MIRLTLPFPPSVNHLWRTRVVTPRGKAPFATTYMSAEGKAYRAEVCKVVREMFGDIRPTNARLRVTITARMPDRRTRDLSNLLKAAEDSLTAAGVWTDDEQIDCLQIKRGAIYTPTGLLEVEIERISDEPAQQKGLFTR